MLGTGKDDVRHPGDRSPVIYVLVNLCRIYGEDSRSRSSHYKSVNVRKGKSQIRGKLYITPTDKGK